jgi:hypothetical protein
MKEEQFYQEILRSDRQAAMTATASAPGTMT